MNTVVFDLDGTLIDSAADIIASLENSLDGAGIRFNAPIPTNVVGPPIHELIDRLGLNRTDEQQLHAIQLFRAHYDHSDMPLTKPYLGAVQLLNDLKRRGWKIYCATNKPAVPTSRLIERFFDNLIDDFCCVDTIPNNKLSKREMLEVLTNKHGLLPAHCVMVGDGNADVKAGREMGWETIAVGWGYGDQAELISEKPTLWVERIEHMYEVLDLISAAAL